MKRSTIYIIFGLFISLIIVPLVVVATLTTASENNSQQLTNNPPVRSDAEVAAAIAKSNQYLRDSSGKPSFKLLKVKRLASNWYMAWIDDSTTKVLVNDPSVSDQYMTTMLGPASTFDKSSIYSMGIPDSVFEEFVNAQIN